MTDEEAYKVMEVTPKEMQCGIAACPRVYRVVSDCMAGACPMVLEYMGDYLIIGKLIEPGKARLDNGTSLEGRIGEGEALVRVPRKLIDDLPK